MIPLGKEYLAMESLGRDGRRLSGGEKLDHGFPPELPDLQPHLLMLLLSSGKRKLAPCGGTCMASAYSSAPASPKSATTICISSRWKYPNEISMNPDFPS